MSKRILHPRLKAAILERFVLERRGIHGPRHWARVHRNGLILSRRTGAITRVVELFAYVHDSCRQSDGHDPKHGERAAIFAEELVRQRLIRIKKHELELLVAACTGHSRGKLNERATVVTCWDADRLDLGRVGIRPNPRKLCTDVARDPHIIQQAWRRSRRRRHRDGR